MRHHPLDLPIAVLLFVIIVVAGMFLAAHRALEKRSHGESGNFYQENSERSEKPENDIYGPTQDYPSSRYRCEAVFADGSTYYGHCWIM